MNQSLLKFKPNHRHSQSSPWRWLLTMAPPRFGQWWTLYRRTGYYVPCVFFYHGVWLRELGTQGTHCVPYFFEIRSWVRPPSRSCVPPRRQFVSTWHHNQKNRHHTWHHNHNLLIPYTDTKLKGLQALPCGIPLPYKAAQGWIVDVRRIGRSIKIIQIQIKL